MWWLSISEQTLISFKCYIVTFIICKISVKRDDYLHVALAVDQCSICALYRASKYHILDLLLRSVCSISICRNHMLILKLMI